MPSSSVVTAVSSAVAAGGGTGSVALTAEKVGALLAGLEGGMTRGEARAAAGVSAGAFLAQYRGNAVFRDAVDDAEGGLWDEAEGALLEAVRAREPWAVREALKHRSMRERWGVEGPGSGSGVGSGVVSAVDVLALGAELERRRAALSGAVEVTGRAAP